MGGSDGPRRTERLVEVRNRQYDFQLWRGEFPLEQMAVQRSQRRGQPKPSVSHNVSLFSWRQGGIEEVRLFKEEVWVVWDEKSCCNVVGSFWQNVNIYLQVKVLVFVLLLWPSLKLCFIKNRVFFSITLIS